MKRTVLGILVAGLAVVAILQLGWMAESEQPSPSQGSEATDTTEERVQEAIDRDLAQRREAMLKEAHAALDETNVALQALDEGNPQEALEALARATGKLELLVARDPELALAPIDMQVVTYDLYATPQAIRAARDQAAELLEEGRVQQARTLLGGLASEIVIRVKNLPLATYPEAIKAVSPLIDEGKTEEAQAALRAALSTLVVTDHVVSLPVVRAGHLLQEAEELLGNDQPSEEQQQKVDELVRGAREQLEMAELLGYGDEQDYTKFRSELAELEKKIRGDEETQGTFARLRSSLDGFQSSFFE